MSQLDVRASLPLDAPSVCMEMGEYLSGVHDAYLPLWKEGTQAIACLSSWGVWPRPHDTHAALPTHHHSIAAGIETALPQKNTEEHR
jgi:hypothetical protein